MLLRTGIGFTVTTTLLVLLQPLAVIVNTYVTLIGAVVLFVSVSLTSAVSPDDAPSVIPGTAALVQLNAAPTVALVPV